MEYDMKPIVQLMDDAIKLLNVAKSKFPDDCEHDWKDTWMGDPDEQTMERLGAACGKCGIDDNRPI